MHVWQKLLKIKKTVLLSQKINAKRLFFYIYEINSARMRDALRDFTTFTHLCAQSCAVIIAKLSVL